MWQLWEPLHSTEQAKFFGQATVFPWHCWFAVQLMVHTPAAQPPVQGAGHAAPSGGGGGLTQLPGELDEADEDAIDEEEAIDEEAIDDVLAVAPPPAPPEPVASGSSWAPRMLRQAGAARAARNGAAAAGRAWRFIRTPP